MASFTFEGDCKRPCRERMLLVERHMQKAHCSECTSSADDRRSADRMPHGIILVQKRMKEDSHAFEQGLPCSDAHTSDLDRIKNAAPFE